jgi:hypothetical protein
MGRSKVKPETLEKERKVLEYRRGGLTFDLIAERLGYASASGAHKAYLSACNRIVYEDVVEVRKSEMDRLDIAQAAIWGDLTDTVNVDANTRARLVLALIKIMERRARLLGLDMPTKAQVEVSIYDRDTIDDEVKRLVAILNSQPQSTLG